MSVSLDCRGLACPEPVIRTRDALKNSPDSIEVCVDNVPATENVSRFLGRSGYVTDIRQSGDSEWKVLRENAGTAYFRRYRLRQ